MHDSGIRKNRVEEALEVAARAHEGQFRKGTGIPYISHPYAVGLILMNEGCPEEVIIAGLLHDTVEDTDMTLDCIQERFGVVVATIVDGCTEDKSLRWRERKSEQIESLRIASPEICIVTCADKLHNIRTVISEYDEIGDNVWDRFHGGFEAQSWYYQSILESLRQHVGMIGIDTKNRYPQKQIQSIFLELQDAIIYLFAGRE